MYKVHALEVSLPRLVDRLLPAGVVDLVRRGAIVDGFLIFGVKGYSLVKCVVQKTFHDLDQDFA
jgi:hypothetical protein